MKIHKIINKLALSAAVLCSLIFTGCFDAVYQSIRSEVELEEGTISGFIGNIARYDSDGGNKYLFVTNGNIYYKDVEKSTHGEWHKVGGEGFPGSVSYSYWDAEFSGVHFYKIIADKDTVYALGYTPVYDSDNSRNVPSKIYLYYTTKIEETVDGSDKTLTFTWAKHELSSNIAEYLDRLDKADDDNYRMDSSVHLFGTNAYNADHRKAFIRIGGGSPYLKSTVNYSWECYELGGSDGSSTLVRSMTYDGSTYTPTSEGGTYDEINRYTLSCVYFDGDYHFMRFLNADTNEGTAVEPTEPTYVYYGDDGEYLNFFAVSEYKNAPNVDAYINIYDSLTASATNSETTVSVNKFAAYFSGMYAESPSVYETDKDGNDVKTVLTGKRAPSEYRPTTKDNFYRVDMDTDVGIISIAVTSDMILLGTGRNRSEGSSSGKGNGAFYVNLDSDGKPATDSDDTIKKATAFDSDSPAEGARAIVSPYHVRAFICATPEKDFKDSDVYLALDYVYTESSSGTSIKNRGLWSYYGGGRNNFNME